MSKPIVYIKKGYEGSLAVQRVGDGGIDIITKEDIEIGLFETKIVPTGLHVKLPDGWYMDVRGRSGLTLDGLHVQLGLVDSNYTGDVGVILCNMAEANKFVEELSTYLDNIIVHCGDDIKEVLKDYNSKTIKISKGERIAQIVFHRCNTVEFKEVDELPKTNRGNRRLGSTGRR